MQVFFSQIFTVGIRLNSTCNSHSILGPFLWQGPPLKFLTLSLVDTAPPEICQFCSRFLLLALVPLVSIPVSHNFLCSLVYLSNLGQWFAPCPPLSCGTKKNCWFFSLFSFLLVIEEWQLSSFLHVELETRNQYIYIYILQWSLVL